MNLSIESERLDDGWSLAEVPRLPGVLVNETSRDKTPSRAQVLAPRVLAERLEHSERVAEPIRISIAA
jgi:hypothetical protein